MILPPKFRFIWPSGYRGKRLFRNWPIRNKNCLWWPCLLMDWDGMSNLCRGLCIDASYQVSVHLAMRFQRRTGLTSRWRAMQVKKSPNEGWLSFLVGQKRSSSRLVILKSLPMSPPAYFPRLSKCRYRAHVYWNLSYPLLSILKVIFLDHWANWQKH